MLPAPNAYSLDAMLGRTVRSSKRQAPQFSMTGRSKVGSFYEDHAKVRHGVTPDVVERTGVMSQRERGGVMLWRERMVML